MTTDDLNASSVLVTGGSEGIGHGMAIRFFGAGANVVITGRNLETLKQAVATLPGLLYFQSDVSKPADREKLAAYIEASLPELNVIINNAGIQRRVSLASDHASWPERQSEIDTLLAGPVHLNHLLIPVLLRQHRPGMIVNISSGGAFVPQVFAPVYSACKAAIHSYTVVLRHALRETPVRVVELAPPAVRTDLAGPGAAHGADLDEFCDSVFKELTQSNADFVGFGPTASGDIRQLARMSEELFAANSSRFPVETYLV